MTAADVRETLIQAPQLEAEQPWETDAPSRWYLTGFLFPTGAPDSQRSRC